MYEIKNQFCIKDRDNFSLDEINNTSDAKFFFGKYAFDNDTNKPISVSVKEYINDALLLAKVPKLIFWGSWGTGKTHLLHYINYFFKDSFTISLFSLELNSKRPYQYLHQKFMEKIGLERIKSVLDDFFLKTSGNALLIEDFFQDKNFENACRTLSIGTPASTNQLLAWKWLCGNTLSTSELPSIGVTSNINEVNMMITIIKKIGSLFKKKGTLLLFLIDEGEKLNFVTDQNAQTSFKDAFRNLSDDDNNTVGFIMTMAGSREDDLPTYILGEETIGRIGKDKIKKLPFLSHVDDIKGFILDLLDSFIDKDKAKEKIESLKLQTTLEYYPLTKESLDQLCEYATQAPTSSYPRNIITCLNKCSVSAYRESSNLIDDKIVDLEAPLIFIEGGIS